MGCTSSSSRSSSPNNSANMRRDSNPNRHTDNSSVIAIDDYSGKMAQQSLGRTARPNETILQAYQRIDEEICQLEKLCPGPRLATVEAWIDHLETMDSETMKTDELMTMSVLPEKKLIDTQNNLSNSIAQMNNSSNKIPDGLDDIDQLIIANDTGFDKENDEVIKVRQLTIQLGVAFDKDKAVVHEEFLAKVSRNIMYILATQLRAEMIEHSKKRAFMLMDSYNRLRYLYTEQDNLITSTSGGIYLSKLEEKLDMELETARQVRDKLGSVSEQWRTSGTLLRTSAKAALQATEFWQLVGPSKQPAERVALALDCRNALLSSLLAFEGAQNALPQVEIPFITPRQASAVRHANIYMLTDMANEARYRHTKQVFETYQANAAKAVQWLHETYNKTLKYDLDNAEDAVLTITKKLRQERLKNLNEFTINRPYVTNTADVR